ncbi:FAS-associated death domain protein [Austrofundulus limnaeus]|uniref:FAS-associated death domain protein n=1 Tax=Austrofundulus limnaeus TaxID=52670 RepID=A0A2I4C9H4_AUSLI|nr:PREDICTED: FAS-associated death domain protein-like [Austrofundulus limnaeus]
METQQFHAVLLDISNRLSSEELNKLKFLVGDEVKKKQQEKITTGHQLFEVLTQRRLLAPDQTGFLSGLLKNIDRPDLSDILNGRPAPSPSGPPADDLDQTERAKLDIATEVISENLGSKWRKLGRKLQVSDVKLESISRRHPTELDETAVELLKEWRKSRGAEARTQDLIKALKDCQLKMTAEKVEDELKSRGYDQ